MAKRGPKGPTISIDWDSFEKLCGIQCTLEEIAAFFKCSTDTIERHVERQYSRKFAEVFSEKRGNGKISLRRTLFQAALKGNTTLLIWLSKQHLGMIDRQETKNDITLSHPQIVLTLPENGSEVESDK